MLIRVRRAPKQAPVSREINRRRRRRVAPCTALQQGHGIIWMLKVRDYVGRGATRDIS